MDKKMKKDILRIERGIEINGCAVYVDARFLVYEIYRLTKLVKSLKRKTKNESKNN